MLTRLVLAVFAAVSIGAAFPTFTKPAAAAFDTYMMFEDEHTSWSGSDGN